MISKQDKQKILNGAYGISRDGSKCKFVGTTTSSNFKYFFVYFNEKGLIVLNAHLGEDFIEYNTTNSRLDVVGLWEDKPEPFDLDKALNGEPVMLRKGLKACIKYVMPSEYKGTHPIRRYVIDDADPDGTYTLSWCLNGKAFKEDYDHRFDIIGMWKEPDSKPESVKPINDLPAPLTKPQDNMYYVNQCGTCWSGYNRNMDINLFNERVYFASEEDARAWFNAMKNHK